MLIFSCILLIKIFFDKISMLKTEGSKATTFIFLVNEDAYIE